ncbi:hypothetical protein X961_2329 [Burkholderia pseudomallei MSHR5613]|nr:hypothetical protein X961_2329 [Burkholderia pseudomallei MSHR5613]
MNLRRCLLEQADVANGLVRNVQALADRFRVEAMYVAQSGSRRRAPRPIRPMRKNRTSGHDANWWASLLVSILTGGYICLQCYYLIKTKGRRGGKHG